MNNQRALFGRKMNNLEELLDATYFAKQRGQKGVPYEVIRDVELENEAFQIFADDFMEDQPWIGKSEGGMNEKGEIRCIRVINKTTGEKILCNPEGYDYCRYVAIEEEEKDHE